MKVYNIVTNNDEFFYFIIELENVNNYATGQVVTKRYYYISIKDGKINFFIRIGSIGTLIDYLDSKNYETVQVSSVDAIDISNLFHKYLIDNSSSVNIDDILDGKEGTPYNNEIDPNDNVTKDINSYFENQKVINYKKVNKNDLTEIIIGSRGIK